jgi:CHAT domain-containing protein
MRQLPKIGNLNRLPDTAEELKSIAAALSASPERLLHLGKKANEHAVKSLDLTRYRFIVFATHGLVPFQLGLTQPAIALSAPGVAGIDGEGLLTMEEVLTLKLDADWVVLSACNTAAGVSEDAEAVVGIGTRILLCGNESACAQRPRAKLRADGYARRQHKDAPCRQAPLLREPEDQQGTF